MGDMSREQVVTQLRAAGCVFAEDEADLLLDAAADRPAAGLDRLVRRRVAGEPLEHLLGWVRFAGLRLEIDPGVFVPRQRTVALAERAALLAGSPAYAGPVDAPVDAPVVVDLCCGCGAIAAVVADRVRGARVFATDLDPAAVTNARRNLEHRGVRVLSGDLFAPLPRSLLGRVDVLGVNAPYVPTQEIARMPPEARDHEPRVALDGGPDGLDVHRRVLGDVRRWLAPGGHLLIEVAAAQVTSALAAFEAAGLVTTVEHDEPRDATVLLGRHLG